MFYNEVKGNFQRKGIVMFDAIKSFGSGFVQGLTTPIADDVVPDNIPASIGDIAGGATRVACAITVGTAALLGVIWEARWLHGVLKIHYKPTNKWYDYAEWCKFLDGEK